MSAEVVVLDEGVVELTAGDRVIVNPKSLRYLESAIASCLGNCMLEYIENHSEEKCPFSKVKVIYSNRTIKILCTVLSDEYVDEFKKIVNDCFILDHLSLDKDIVVKVL